MHWGPLGTIAVTEGVLDGAKNDNNDAVKTAFTENDLRTRKIDMDARFMSIVQLACLFPM